MASLLKTTQQLASEQRQRWNEWAMRRYFVAAVISLLLIVAIVVIAAPHLPGFSHTQANTDAYWIAYWSAFWAALIIAVPISITVAGLLSTWERSNRKQEATQDALRDLQITIDQLKYPLSVPIIRQIDIVPLHRIALATINIKESIDVLATKPLHFWKEQLVGCPQESSTLDCMISFQSAYIDYRCQEAKTAVEFNRMRAQAFAETGPEHLVGPITVIGWMLHSLGLTSDEVSQGLGFRLDDVGYKAIAQYDSARDARESYIEANEVLETKLEVLTKELDIQT